MAPSRPIRAIVAKIGLDGHDQGAKVVAQHLRDAGMEVIYTGIRQSVEKVVSAALQENADVIGVSVLSGSHVPIARKLMARLRQEEMDDVLVLMGGIIPPKDVAVLQETGIHGVFPVHSSLRAIVEFIREQVPRLRPEPGPGPGSP